MAMYLGSYVGTRDNNFALLRMIAALAVIVSHSFAFVLGGPQFEPWRSTIGSSPGNLAVDLFFVASGFLVTRSLAFRKSGSDFVGARFMRIFPGLALNLVVVAAVVGPFFSAVPLLAYFTDGKVLSFVSWNLQMLFLPYPVGSLPGLTLMNGSLWTLPVEVCCYAVLLCTWLVAKRPRRTLFYDRLTGLALVVGGVAVWRFMQQAGFHLAWMFASGALFYLGRDRIKLSGRFAAIALVVLAVSIVDRRLFQASLLICGPYLVFCTAYLPGGWIRSFNRLGDYSYGTYIYGWPVQFAVSKALPVAGVWLHAAASISITLALAVLSWHLVEARALKAVPRLQTVLQRLVALARASQSAQV